MKKFVIIIISMLTLVMLSGCIISDNSETNKAPPIVKSFGYELYYFSATEDRFGEQLTLFKKENPCLEIVSIASDDDSLYGHTKGYFVQFKKKESCNL